MNAIKGFVFGGMLAAVGCAAGMRGSVVRAPAGGVAEVRISNGTVAPGERVVVSRKVCSDDVENYANPLQNYCSDETIGRATVSQIVASGYATMQLDPGVTVRKGDMIATRN
jgi:hypothetical protein